MLIGLVSGGLVVAALVLQALHRTSPPSVAFWVSDVLSAVVYAAATVVMLPRVRHPVAWIMAATAVGSAFAGFATQYYLFAVDRGGAPAADLVVLTGGWTWVPGAYATVTVGAVAGAAATGAVVGSLSRRGGRRSHGSRGAQAGHAGLPGRRQPDGIDHAGWQELVRDVGLWPERLCVAIAFGAVVWLAHAWRTAEGEDARGLGWLVLGQLFLSARAGPGGLRGDVHGLGRGHGGARDPGAGVPAGRAPRGRAAPAAVGHRRDGEPGDGLVAAHGHAARRVRRARVAVRTPAAAGTGARGPALGRSGGGPGATRAVLDPAAGRPSSSTDGGRSRRPARHAGPRPRLGREPEQPGRAGRGSPRRAPSRRRRGPGSRQRAAGPLRCRRGRRADGVPRRGGQARRRARGRGARPGSGSTHARAASSSRRPTWSRSLFELAEVNAQLASCRGPPHRGASGGAPDAPP